jgi:hypothetical protein
VTARKKQLDVERVAREFGKRVLETTKRRDPKAEKRSEAHEAELTKALAEHLAKRKK